MWRFVLAAVLGLTVGATGRADAGVIFSYNFLGRGCSGGGVNLDCTLEGSFQVDSDHIDASGNTDISSFITNLSFTLSAPAFGGEDVTFDPTTEFGPDHVMVTSTGNFAGTGQFVGGSAFPFETFLGVDAVSGIADYEWNFDSQLLEGEGTWTGPTVAEDAPVPEPATWALVSVGALVLLAHTRRRRDNSAKVA